MSGLHRKSICTEHSSRHIAICIQITRADTEIRNVFPGKAGFHIPAWGIERNLKWQSGSYAMGPESVEQATRLSFLQPEDGKHVQLSPEETVYILSRSAYKQLKEQQTLVYNQTTYSVLDSNERALGYPLIHVKDAAEGCEMWILDNPKLALVWKTCNNPLGVNWEVE